MKMSKPAVPAAIHQKLLLVSAVRSVSCPYFSILGLLGLGSCHLWGPETRTFHFMRRTRTETAHVRRLPRRPARFAPPRRRCNRFRCLKPTSPRLLRSRSQFAAAAGGRLFETACGSNAAGAGARRC